MSIKILHCSDFHIGASFSGLDRKRANIRRDEILSGFSLVIDYFKEKSFDALIISGDLFDTPYPSKKDADFVRERLLSISDFPVFIVCGNHDFLSPDSVFSNKDFFGKNVHIFSPNGESVYIEKLNAIFHGISYKTKLPPENKCDFNIDEGKTNILCIHGNITKSSEYFICDQESIKNSSYDYVALGHIHDSEIFSVGDTVCAYAGTPEGHSFADSKNVGFVGVEIGEKTKASMISLPKRRYVHIDINVDSAKNNDEIAQKIKDVLVESNLYKIRLVGSPDCTVALSYIKEKTQDCAFYIELTDDTDSYYDIEALLNSQTFKGEFLREVKSSASDNTIFEMAVKIGLDALDGKKPKMR